MEKIDIKIDNLKDGLVIELLQEHHQEMFAYSPAESIHALDISSLNEPSLTIWSARVGGSLAGCGGLKELNAGQAEIKSMRTAKAFLQKGVGSQVLQVILAEAAKRGYKQVSLETGTHEAFLPVQMLYKRFGFRECGPFGVYTLDPYSTFMTLDIEQATIEHK